MRRRTFIAATAAVGLAGCETSGNADLDGGRSDGAGLDAGSIDGGAIDAHRERRDAVVATDLPAWRIGQELNSWREIAGSAMTIAPSAEATLLDGTRAIVGPVARMNAWCGLSIDTRSAQVWSVANGGHGDYFGNEVCVLDLMRDRPEWEERFPGSSGNVVDGETPGADPSHAYYRDGLPCSTHSYFGQQFLERQNRALRLGGSTAPIGSAFENVEGFDAGLLTGVNGWDPPGTFGFCLGNQNGGWTPAIGWPVCKDPRTEEIYSFATPHMYRFTPSAAIGGEWARIGSLPDELNSALLGATAIDTLRDRLLWIKGYGSRDRMVFDLRAETWSYPGDTTLPEFLALTNSPGMIYVPALDRYLVRGHAPGPTVIAIDPETWECSTFPTTGGDGVPRGAVLSGEEGVYTRWLLAPTLGGVVYFPAADANAWFLRLA